jgi:copper transport protein
MVAIVVALALPAGASAHAVLRQTEPLSGAILKRQPKQIVFRFNEPVEGTFGALQIYDRNGARIDQGDSYHPGGRSEALAVALKPKVPKATYTATYRVISADGHPVSGGLVFSIGKATAAGATVSELLAERGQAGHVTQVAFGVARGLQYTAIALAIGAAFFLVAVWLPGLAAASGGGREWRESSEAFVARLRLVVLIALLIGLFSGALGIVFQGATAGGTSFWSALHVSLVRKVLQTRFGTIWGLRELTWLWLVGAMTGVLVGHRRPVLRPAEIGATGLALRREGRSPLSLAALAFVGLPLAFLAVSPALAGHASLQHPTALLFPANVVHVVAMSIWAGGLAVLVLVLPAATRRLERVDRTSLLAGVLARFSGFALLAVAALVVTGLVQAIVEVRTPHNAIYTAFGRAALIKAVLLAGPLMALGAYNRRVSVPQLRALARDRAVAGQAGLALRRALRVEVALIAVVIGVTAALVSYAPSIAVSRGPVAVTKSLGPADLQFTVDPARVGPNQVHAYLIDKRTGAQYTKVKEFSVTFTQPKKSIGPLKVEVRKGGPGHYVMPGAVFGVSGDWLVKIEARVSRFDAYYATVPVEIR